MQKFEGSESHEKLSGISRNYVQIQHQRIWNYKIVGMDPKIQNDSTNSLIPIQNLVDKNVKRGYLLCINFCIEHAVPI